ncbi:MAG: FecR domain-containing protein [Balneolaceae bacterium]|nr:FecR domain-containing protein [Balneolaceae bacterium]
MATDQQLPPNDPDLMLAQEIEASLNTGSSFADLGNPLIDQLIAIKNKELATYSIPATVSDNIWNQISKQTTQRKANVTPLFSRTSTFAWASAAVVLIAAFIGFFWLQMQPQLELMAQSESTIEQVTLQDGSEVTLRPYSKLFVDRSSTNRSYSIEGEAFFDVVSNPDSPFTVDATFGTVTVLGTRFNLSNWGGKAVVYLEEGSVSFSSNQTDEAVILQPGQASEITKSELQLLSESNAEEFTDWQSNSLVFNSSDPAEVINEINQHFGVIVNIDQLQDRSEITGTLILDSVTQTLDDLGLVLGGTFRSVNANEYEFISME